MKTLFYIGLIGLSLFEILNVYFIMPMPGSQRMSSLELAYFLYSSRWLFRAVFILMAVIGMKEAMRATHKWIPVVTMILVVFITGIFNIKMRADKMFLQPESILLKNKTDNELPETRLVLGVEHNGEAKAYPIEFLTYHHQVVDSVGGKQVMVTYCSVCRTGRVFEPVVNGRNEKFRLVGMDHFNAIFEDVTTRSWWRQVSGEAVAGKLKGHSLPEIASHQMTIEKWFELYPHGLVMQEDEYSVSEYDSLTKFELGKSTSKLTGTDSLSWNDKSWVVGIQIGNSSKAYDWNELKRVCIIHDTIDSTGIVIALSSDQKSFTAFKSPAGKYFSISNDTLLTDGAVYDFKGQNINDPKDRLQHINASQEFWHSWLTFHPKTLR